jgi:hypothetical protein
LFIYLVNNPHINNEWAHEPDPQIPTCGHQEKRIQAQKQIEEQETKAEEEKKGERLIK